MFKQRYGILSSITTVVVGFCDIMFKMLFNLSDFPEAIHFLDYIVKTLLPVLYEKYNTRHKSEMATIYVKC